MCVHSDGKGVQAIALSAQAASGYYGCSFYGFQDTLLANEDQQFYYRCLITGATDFIYGQRAQVWFEQCDIRVLNGGTYITANGRDSSTNPSYYLFNGGTIDTASGESVSSRTYYLGRPWRDYARVVFQNTAMSSVIRTEGWTVWSSSQSTDNIYYGEYANTGDGASGTRVSWAKVLSSAVSRETVLGSGYAASLWYDASYPGSSGGATSTTTSAPPTNTGCSAMWGQCGGEGWTGPTCCASGTCTYSNDWYSQCL